MYGFGFKVLWLCASLLFVVSCAHDSRSEGQALTTFAPIDYADAHALGGQILLREPGAYMARTSGVSMKPILSRNTIIIVRPIAFDQLEEGMVVGYRSRHGYQVLHQLVRRLNAEAWIAKGLNNPEEDEEPVTADNLLGVLYTVLYNEASAGR
ncbi:S24/S26 family peptidase [Coraliomargarita akajimensis]|uniref:Peptidase S24/S26A/S26B/S26C domain-containing protein n=1 Tax=Coraliomargarita akajimensis (strain DSM 45221 / IAM 15411 / JCM 23193 / KCTC 12865 / 04OKA010-24) TaxID=583355 RepID=D5EJ95_CORAD|nr:S24/S26 family peptidase [Coraliomargarita akajimensis]ADE54494.1 hypothetical protein Caka_1475 [Coraliomargarita akajimensis DSM 45221]